MTTAQRIISLRLLQLILSLREKQNQLQSVGIQLDIMNDLYEHLVNTLFEVNGIELSQGNVLWLILEDYVSGSLKDFEFLSLLVEGQGGIPQRRCGG
ncbi:hypothetical protein H1230_18820 [Paenibacillus sp. 19GGS1-52]|uniref:hypothetical protein n=1 Tax=Paenibacillus sp. 19GGS1-52 TaxID=2758563 RepID=UPI001EFBE602|nr:hypothetical protein [Paenibacillus sp. 19GGS1-52]ULO05163.1 hypothetical protein H1230_18820 [Paenibacillus sp. 19GGS1-52]